MRLRPLYSVPRNLTEITLPPEDGFDLAVTTAGNPKGLPVLVLHGGPGGGIHSSMFRFFHPDLFHVIGFDQRGCGQSGPNARTEHNDTWKLLDDVQRIRAHFGIDRWIIFGGSWGSTLALVAAQQQPEQVLGLVLRGIFLGRPQELDWFLYGIQQFFPDAWQDFARHVDGEDGGDLLALYQQELAHSDPDRRVAAARAWARYETSCSTLMPTPFRARDQRSDDLALSLATLEAHYFANNLFLGNHDILRECDRIKQIPTEIIQGRYDAVCPPISAYELHRALPHSNLTIVPNAGHSSMENGTASALITAVEALANELRQTEQVPPLQAAC